MSSGFRKVVLEADRDPEGDPRFGSNAWIYLFYAEPETQALRLEATGVRKVWGSPVFAGIMGPVVEIGGLLVGHHQRRLTALDGATGEQVWQLPDETDGQLLALGPWLVFVNDRAGELGLLSVSRSGVEVRTRRRIMESTRMETPLAFAYGVLYIRTPRELIALRVD